MKIAKHVLSASVDNGWMVPQILTELKRKLSGNFKNIWYYFYNIDLNDFFLLFVKKCPFQTIS